MNFITVDQFNGQPKDIQKIFIDWWQPIVGDLIYDKSNIVGVLVPVICFGDYKTNIDKTKHIPLLNETQLSRFIEDKTGCIICSKPYKNIDSKWVYHIELLPKDDKSRAYSFEGIQLENYLQTLWQIACKIALESTK